MMSSALKAGSKISVQPDDIRQQYTECAECKNEYNDFLRTPRVLPCLHGICISCLESTATRGIVKCPTCEIRHNVPNGDLEAFRPDETRLFLVNHQKVQGRTPDIGCQECTNKTRVAKHRCKECAQFLCDECNDAHCRTKITKRHHILTMDELKDAPLDDFQQVHFCTVPGHEEQPYAFFCLTSTCDRPICAMCAVADHQESKGHDIRELHEVYMDTRRSIEGLMSDVKHRTLSAQDTAASIETTIDNLDTSLQHTTHNIDTAFDNSIKALERRRSELKDKAHARAREKKKRLENQLDSINFHINSMEDANEFSANIATYGSQSEFLFFKDTIIERLNHLRDEEFDTLPHDNDEIKFRNTKLGEDFNKHVRDMGGIWSTSAYVPNTHVDTNDVIVDREQTILHITLFDSEGMQQSDSGVDLRVDVLDPSGRRRGATVVDNTSGDGRYKAVYLGTSKGKHRATVYLHGTPMQNDHVFRVSSPHTVERLDLHGHGGRDQMKISRSMRTATPSGPGFVLDATTSSPSVEILEEGKTMKAKISKGSTTRRTGREQGRFAIYRGAMASRPIQKSGLYYFEVGVVYKVHKLIRQEHVFEIGLSKLDCIDRHPSVDCHPYAWCVSARGCHVCGKVCLQTWHNGQLLSHTAISARTKSPPGTFIRLYYGFLLDAERRHWIITDVKNKKLIFRFKNLVVSEMSEPLWPVFSVSSPEVTQTVLTIKTGRVIDVVPDEALEALAP
ncbi:TRI45-like protein [Mya arenaria]|uniref:TRI45-like protein n=1 Tax=Mya arenaria TaxID=6604 RepID=A0ABY7E1Q3_MYAAR|nr:TRI45-like protein [Mya arenaria]